MAKTLFFSASVFFNSILALVPTISYYQKTMEETEKLTPMLAQYRDIKKSYPDALLFFRMGDFYELFFADAEIASRELQITLTSRGKSGGNSAPMCGVPWHSSQSYIAQLIDKGYNVAICDQIEDPRESKGLVARAVTRVVTPGTALDETNIDSGSHNYLGAVFCGINNTCAFAWADISTGQWSGIEFKRQVDLWQWVRKLAPRELLAVDGQQIPQGLNIEGMRLAHQPVINFDLKRSTERILQSQGVRELEALSLEGKPSLIRACGAILAYLEQTQLCETNWLMPFRPLDLGRRLIIDEVTERNLEIFTMLNGRKGKGTLRHVLDSTITPMGSRLMEDMLRHPWRDLKPIRLIQNCVSWFHSHDRIRGSLRKALEGVLDLERLIVRISLGRSSARDLFALRQSLEALPEVFAPLQACKEELPQAMSKLLSHIDLLEDCAALLRSALVEELKSEDNLFRPGYNAALDRELELLNHGEGRLQDMLEREREKTGISRLKLGQNRVFGYYFEVSRSSLPEKLPEHFTRRQTLATTERFTTQELKSLEEDLLMAASRREELEKEMLSNLKEHFAAQKERVLETADCIAQLDYWQCLAEVGRKENWHMPVMDDSVNIHIQQGRHPVVESILGRANFVPNDFHMDQSRRLCLITGPNMAGKSTILRQTAIICLLAQMGGMVPAACAELGIVDRLFSRVGASDNLAQGQSTFMVEMMETARIIRQAGKRSLIILDEIGRGTGTFDGMALAWAIAEDLAGRSQGQLRTIFATHYHELTRLEKSSDGVFTMNVAVGAVDNNEIVFLHRLLPGPSDKSYGVEVARLAGVPYPVIQRARDILKKLERDQPQAAPSSLRLPGMEQKPGPDDIINRLLELDPESLAPEEALSILRELKENLEAGKNVQ